MVERAITPDMIYVCQEHWTCKARDLKRIYSARGKDAQMASEVYCGRHMIPKVAECQANGWSFHVEDL